jgi:hypothetical protein
LTFLFSAVKSLKKIICSSQLFSIEDIFPFGINMFPIWKTFIFRGKIFIQFGKCLSTRENIDLLRKIFIHRG